LTKLSSEEIGAFLDTVYRDCLKSFLSSYTIGLTKINNLSYMQRFYFRYIGLQHQ